MPCLSQHGLYRQRDGSRTNEHYMDEKSREVGHPARLAPISLSSAGVKYGDAHTGSSKVVHGRADAMAPGPILRQSLADGLASIA